MITVPTTTTTTIITTATIPRPTDKKREMAGNIKTYNNWEQNGSREWRQNDWDNSWQRGWQNGCDDPLQDAGRNPWRAQVHQQQYHPQPQHREQNESRYKVRAKGKGRGKRRAPKDDETKKREVHFLNFPEMERARHMAFLIQIIETYGFRDMIELETDNDGDLLPVMYPFGYQFAKSSAIRFKRIDQAQEALWTLRGN